MPHLTLAEYILDFVTSALQCVIVIVIFRRKLYKSFPAFTASTIFQLLKTTFLHVELALPVSFLTYSYSFYSIEPCSMALELWVVYEVFKTVLEPYEALRRSWRFIFLISVVALVLVNVLWIAYEPKTKVDLLTRAILDLMQSDRVIQVGLLLVIFALSGLMGLSWRSYCFGVALGFGTYAAAEMVGWEMRRRYGWEVWDLLNTIRSVSYAVSILIWGSYFFQPPEVARPVWVVPQNNIEKWNDVLEGMLARRTG
jgi:hypothetical protein